VPSEVHSSVVLVGSANSKPDMQVTSKRLPKAWPSGATLRARALLELFGTTKAGHGIGVQLGRLPHELGWLQVITCEVPAVLYPRSHVTFNLAPYLLPSAWVRPLFMVGAGPQSTENMMIN